MVIETWIKPNGAEIQINEGSQEAALSLGWVPKNAVPVIQMTQAVGPIVETLAPKRRGRPPKAKEV